MLIDILLIIAVGCFLLWAVRKARFNNKLVSKMTPKQKEQLVKTLNQTPKRNILIGGSVTKLSGWWGIAILVIFALAFYASVESIS